MDNTEVINVLSLCTGYGGLDIGLARALQRPLRIVAVEVEAFALANLVAKAEQGKMAIEALWPDLKTFPAEKFRGCFDIITAGYPCQPFSVAGKRQGHADPRHLWPYIERIIEAVRPVYGFFENVPGHLTIGFAEVYRSLRNLGYSVEAELFTAAEVGAPHRRQRLFILAHTGYIPGRRKHKELERRKCGIRKSGKGMADTADLNDRQRCQNQQGTDEAIKKRRQANRGNPKSTTSSQRTKWPARPGQPQYEWEEPRIVANNTNTRTRQDKRKIRRCPSRGDTGIQRQSKTQTKPELGRAVNGPAGRVDRLRLLGNGVVPQCAEKAFRELRG